MEIDIRTFRPKDAHECSFLIRETLRKVNRKDYPQEVISFLSNEMSPKKMLKISKERHFLVAVKNKNIIGTGTIEDGTIQTVFVHPNFLGKNVGSTLMNSLEEFSLKSGKRKISLYSSITAVEFYNKLGYHKKKKVDTGPRGWTWLMEKHI